MLARRRAIRPSSSISTSGGWSGASWCASCSTITTRRPPTASPATRRRRCAAIISVDQHFTAGWIALRFLHDPATAAAHFALIPQGTVNPHALARAGYWQGRAADAMGQHAQAKAFYEQAATHSATYYGQLARARLGLPDLGLRGPPKFTPEERATLSKLEVVRAVEILYALDERDLVAPIYAELGESGTDVAGLAALGEVAGAHGDGRSMLLLGQGALSAACRSTITPIRWSACPTTSRSRRRSSRRWPIRSPARKATSTRRSSRAPTPWG